MITTRYIDVAFGGARSAMARALYQYDYGQVLRITDLTLPFAYEVHFADTKTGNSVTMIGNADGVEIPDACLLTSGNVYCWFYLHDTESDGETRYEVLIPILARAKPTNASPTPVQQDVIDQAIAALDAAVQQTGEDVIAAGASASAAAGSASDAEAWAVGERNGEPVESTDPTYHNNSKYYAGESASAAQTASQDAQTASDAAIAAGNAKTAAETAQGKAEDAQTAAEAAAGQTALDVIAAGQSANAASGYANTASGYASDASGYATAAQGYANDASGYASSASGYATNAYNSAQAAAGSAGEASGYASDASGYATAAGNAKTDAEAAKTAAETAQGLAEAAQTGAETAQTAAESARDAAVAATEDKAPVILDSASGSIVSIVDGAGGMNARSLVAAFSPIQSGSGDPSPDNIRPISGRTGVTVTRTGKNLLNNTDLFTWGNWSATVAPDGDMKSQDANRIFTFPKLEAGKTYVISFGFVGSTFPEYLYFGYHKDGTATRLVYITTNVLLNTEFSFTAVDGYNYCLRMGKADAQTRFDNQIANWSNCQLEIGSTASAYEPYTGTSYPVSWQTEAGTVYGGTVDLVSGVLTVTNIGMAFDGTEDWKAPADAGYFLYIINASTSYGVSNTGICSHLPLATNISGLNSVTGFRPYGRSPSPSGFVVIMRFDPTKQQTLTEFKNFLSAQDTEGTPVTVVYELSEPQTYQLDPQTVSMLLGKNNLWTTGDTVSLTYPCDTKLYMERLTAPTEDDMIANANIPIHKFFMIGNSLYYSTAAIAQGAAIVVGTNCNAVSLADALNQLA